MTEIVADKSYDLNNTTEYNLSIRVSMDGFSFFITDSNHQNLIAVKNDPLKISSESFLTRRLAEWIDSQDLLKKTYRTVRILFFTRLFTLIPEEYYGVEKSEEVFQRLFGSGKNRLIRTNTVSQINSKLLFSVPADLETEFKSRYTNYHFVHPVEILLQNLPPEKDESREGRMWVFLCSDFFYVLIFKQDKLLVTNSYNYLHFNDILYFVLSNLQQCNLEPGNTKLYLSGNLTGVQQNEAETGLKKYVGSVQRLKPTLNINPKIFDNHKNLHSLFLLK